MKSTDDLTEFTFIPVRYCSDSELKDEAPFLPTQDASYTFSSSDFVGEGGYGKVYRVKGWLRDGTTSFRSLRANVNSYPSVFTDFDGVSDAAIKVFENIQITKDLMDAVQYGRDPYLISEILKRLEDVNTEYRRMVVANGANGHVPKPYALGWAISEGIYKPAMLMEFLPSGEDGQDSLCHPYNLVEEKNGQLIPKLSTYEIILAGIELCKAVRCLHDTGMSHRDLSYKNVLLRLAPSTDSHGPIPTKAYLFDLGNSTERNGEISMRMEEDDSSSARAFRQHMATPGFGAPEVFTRPTEDTWSLFSQRNNFKADSYELASLLYFLRTGNLFPHSDPPKEVGFKDDEASVRLWNDWVYASSPEEGFRLPRNYKAAGDPQLSDIIQSCSKRIPEKRMGVDWMLMSLWELAESLGGPGTLEHYSWFIDPMPSPGIDFVVDKEAKDPLAQFPGLQWNPPAHADDEDKDTQPISTEATAQAGLTPQHPPKGESHESVPIVYENPSPRTNKKPVGQHMQGIAVDAVIRKFTAAYNRKGFHQYSGSSLAQYDAGLSNMRSGNVRDAIQLIKQSADAGYTPAYIYLARYHYERHEDQLTTRYLLSAIESGNAWGLACLAILMAEGRGVKKSIDDACAILQVGYNVSDAYCANNLGVLFFKHSATPGFDSKDVVTFFSKAVEWGCEAAARNLWNLGSRLNWPDWIDVTEINKLVNRFPAQLKSKNGDSQDIVFVWPSIER